MKRSFVFLLLFILGLSGYSQHEINRKGRLFFYWGYNRAVYTKSDFHIKGEGYDLTFHDIEGTDRPTPFSVNEYLKPANISQPQYNYRLGYYLNNKWSISFGMDHLKYFMPEEPVQRVSGYVTKEASEKYQGTYDGSEIYVPWRFLWFHHSDGLNYASVELEYNYSVWAANNKKFHANVIGNVGAGLAIPKTYVMILNTDEDNRFHIAGGGPSAKLGARFTFWSNFYFESAFKTGYIWLPNILVNSKSNDRAHQHFGWLEFYGAVGFSVPLTGKKSNKNETP